ncbi:MAG TPA: hypothetical protein VNA21_04945, partial [Steroidobacteraceae bacterium]|nr:hypothetical protein [Steroidobacteraceae bacterium]
SQAKPSIPAGVTEYYSTRSAAKTLMPRVLGTVRLHFADKATGVDAWETRSYLAPLSDGGDADWPSAEVSADLAPSLTTQAPQDARYLEGPATLLRAQSYQAWAKALASFAFERATLEVFRSALVDTASAASETESEFRARVALSLREKRDEAVEALRRKYAPKLTSLEDQIRRAQERIARERSQLSEQKVHTALSVGTSILGALLGRKKLSATNVGRIETAARGAGRIGRESGDVERAEESLEVLQRRRLDLDSEFEQETQRLQTQFDSSTAAIDRVSIKPRKSDIEVKETALVWVSAE